MRDKKPLHLVSHANAEPLVLSKIADTSDPGLPAYLKKTEIGQPIVYHSPWIADRYDKLITGEQIRKNNEFVMMQFEEIMNSWMHKIKSLSFSWPGLLDYENALRSKAGPLSVEKPFKDRLMDVDAYYTGILLPASPISSEALELVCTEFKEARGLRMSSLGKTWDNMRKNTNSGLPYFTKRKNAYADTVGFNIKPSGTILYPTGREYPAVAVLGWSGREGGPSVDQVKQRVIFMFPMAVNWAELTAYQPLIRACQKHNLVASWVGMPHVDMNITRMFDTMDRDDVVVCTDFTKFDQHFNQECQSAAEKILRYLFRPSPVADQWFQNVFPIKYDIPLLVPNLVLKGRHGMGSGSGGTNADETLVHRALQHEAALRQHTSLNPYSQCLGDDGVLTYPGIDIDKVVETYSSHGLEMNSEKQGYDKDSCTYLRRWHHRHYRVEGVCVGVYSTARALNRLLLQERYYDPAIWNEEMVVLRELSIIENCKYHPLFEEFADFCVRRDKYRLGLDIPGFFDADNLNSLLTKATAKIPYFLGYVQSEMSESVSYGLQSWRIVQYLKMKA